MKRTLIGTVLLTLVAVSSGATSNSEQAEPPGLLFPGEEKHLANIKQLTTGGENAEAYFSADGKQLIFQSTRPPLQCDQIFIMNLDGGDPRQVSTGKGRTTCGYIFPKGDRIIYSSTHLASPDCPPRPDMTRGYVWQLYDSFDIFSAKPDGSDLRQLTNTPGYDAEATVSPNGKKIVFTSTRDGDPDIYLMDADGRNVKRLTRTPGYDGGAFFSHDGKRIVYRGNHPRTKEEFADYQELNKSGLIRPMRLELFVMDNDGGRQRQITNNSAANFAPYFHPDNQRIIFASNMQNPKGRDFDLYLINEDGNKLERITFNPTFDGFPMFSPDGKKLVFSSNRNAKTQGDTNVFIADWVP
jgi:Tol biopolymer transport system component